MKVNPEPVLSADVNQNMTNLGKRNYFLCPLLNLPSKILTAADTSSIKTPISSVLPINVQSTYCNENVNITSSYYLMSTSNNYNSSKIYTSKENLLLNKTFMTSSSSSSRPLKIQSSVMGYSNDEILNDHLLSNSQVRPLSVKISEKNKVGATNIENTMVKMNVSHTFDSSTLGNNREDKNNPYQNLNIPHIMNQYSSNPMKIWTNIDHRRIKKCNNRGINTQLSKETLAMNKSSIQYSLPESNTTSFMNHFEKGRNTSIVLPENSFTSPLSSSSSAIAKSCTQPSKFILVYTMFKKFRAGKSRSTFDLKLQNNNHLPMQCYKI